MAQPLKAVKNRLKSIENTKKVTNAMQMISVVKLNRTSKVLSALRPYALKAEGILNRLLAMQPPVRHLLFEKRMPVKKKVLCVITSDSGLCGFYNLGIFQIIDDFLLSNKKEDTIIVVVGKRGYNFLKNRQVMVQNVYLGLSGRYSREVADKLSAELTNLFLDKKADEVWCVYNHFENVVIQRPGLEKILPLEPKSAAVNEYILEPQADILINELALENIIMKIRRIICEAFSAEHAARIVAMKSATDNAKELFDDLTLMCNKIRQASITQDLMEIISSVEALKG